MMGNGRFSYPLPAWAVGFLSLMAGFGSMALLAAQAPALTVEYGFGIGARTAALAVFLVGFAAGAPILGAIGDRSSSPLRWIAALQVLLGLAAMGLGAGVLQVHPGLLTHAAILTLVPGLLAGGTFTLLVRAGSHTTSRGALSFGLVSGAHAIGGVLALVAVGRLSGALPVFVPLIGAVCAFALSVKTAPREVLSGNSSGDLSGKLSGGRRMRWLGDADGTVLFALAVTGMVLPIARFGWNRYLPAALDRADAGAVGLLLQLAGLGLGSLAGMLLVAQGTNARRRLARAMLVAVLIVVAPVFYSGVAVSLGGLFAAAALTIPAAFAAGLVLAPLAQVALADRDGLGRQTGTALAIFSAGWAIGLGIVVPGLAFSVSGITMIAIAAALLLAGGTVLGIGRGLREWVPAGAATLGLVLALLSGGAEASASNFSAVSNPASRGRVITERMNGAGSWAVVESLRDGARRLYRDGVTAEPAGSYVERYRILAHLPVLLQPSSDAGSKRAAVLRCGTGTAALVFANMDSVNSVDLLAEEDAALDLLSGFDGERASLLSNPKVRRDTSAIRPFLRDNTGGFDLVTMEPWPADSVRGRLMFSAEFYRLVRSSLGTGGLFCQRLPTESANIAALRTIVAAADDQFEFCSIWDLADGLFLVAGDALPELAADTLLARFARVAPDLQAARVGDTAHLLASCVCSGATFREQAEPFRDGHPLPSGRVTIGERSDVIVGYSRKNGPEWAEGLDARLPAIAARGQRLRVLLAQEQTRSEDLFVLAAEDRGDLRARAAAELRLYQECVQKGEFAAAARLMLVRDRSASLRGLAGSLEGERRRYYSLLLLGEGATMEPEEMELVADSLAGPEKLYVTNRARILRGAAPAEGEEARPSVELRDPTPALEAWDVDEVQNLVLDAACANRTQEFDDLVLVWWEACDDQLRAVILLDTAGWKRSIRVARKLAGRGVPEELIALAPLFAAAYPADRTWNRLCSHRSGSVRIAMAEAARAHGTQEHVSNLVTLCEDPDSGVRTGAFHSLQAILGEAVRATGFDPKNPSPEAIAKLKKLS
jgi:spermidine synthase